MKHIVSVPEPQMLPQPKTSADCPFKVYLINTYPSYTRSVAGVKTFDIYYSKIFVCEAQKTQRLYFDKTFVTSLPAKCLVYGSQYLYRHGLSYAPTIISTNDTYVNIIIFNHTCETIILNPNMLHFHCTVILPGHNF